MLRGAERGGRKEAGRREGCRGAALLLRLRCREDGNCLTTELHARFLPLPARSSSVHSPAPLLGRAAGPARTRPRPDGANQPRRSETEASLPRAAFGGCWVLVTVLAKGRSPGAAAPCAHAAALGRAVAAHCAVATHPPPQEQGRCWWLRTSPSPHTAWPPHRVPAAPWCHCPGATDGVPLTEPSAAASPGPQHPGGRAAAIAQGWDGSERGRAQPRARFHSAGQGLGTLL